MLTQVGLKSLPVTNTLAYFDPWSLTKRKSYITFPPKDCLAWKLHAFPVASFEQRKLVAVFRGCVGEVKTGKSRIPSKYLIM